MTNKETYIQYRINRAKETIEEAKILAENNKWNATVNRLYYASFYSIISLLLKSQIETLSHDGVRTQFSLHFIKTEKLPKKYGKLFSKLFDFRQKGDYGDMFDFDEETVKPLIDQTIDLINEIEKLLNR